VKHRSPLITLAAVALAFAIMFIVNMTVSPPGRSSTGSALSLVTATVLEPKFGNQQVAVAGEVLTAVPISSDEGL
jgi:hypothetical protein